MMHIGPESWFAVQVVPQHELRVASLLANKKYQQFVPTYLSRRRWADRVKTLQKPLFPGYVFCRVTEASHFLVCTTPGVVRIVGFKGRPSPIPDEEIQAIQRIVESRTEAYPCGIHLKLGQRVQVATGPLAGITGTLVNLKNRSHLVISVDLVMKAISVDADAFEVRPIRECQLTMDKKFELFGTQDQR